MSFGGKEHKVHSSDNVPISIDSIIANPNADCCKALKGKRTSEKSWDRRTRASGAVIANTTDFVFCYQTLEVYNTHSQLGGMAYIQEDYRAFKLSLSQH